MSGYEDYWLFPSAYGEIADNTIPAVQTPFVSLEEARKAATRLGGAIDIFGAPARGGTLRLVEHVGGMKEGQKHDRGLSGGGGHE